VKTIRIGINPSNPVLIYIVLWSAVLWLTSLRLTINLIELKPATIVLVLSNIISLIVIYALVSAFFSRTRLGAQVFNQPDLLKRLRVFVNWLLILWFLGSIVEIVAAGGVPIVWLFTGSGKSYADFGISTFHGLLTSFYMLSVTATFLDYHFRKDRKSLFKIVALLFWPIVLINRGALVWTIAQVVGLYLMLNRTRLRTIVKALILITLVALVFGWVGDLRLGANRDYISNQIDPNSSELFKNLPSGFHWAYIYVTAPINNVNGAIENLNPSYSFYYSTVNLFPTVIRTILYDPSTKYPFAFVNEAFNTSTFYANFLSDFGIPGAIALVCVLQFLTVLCHQYARRGHVGALLAYAVLFQAMTLSVFADTFTSWVTLAQVFLALTFEWNYRRRLKHMQARRDSASRFHANA
jgi:oligosaccharide repeat unit polymerase